MVDIPEHVMITLEMEASKHLILDGPAYPRQINLIAGDSMSYHFEVETTPQIKRAFEKGMVLSDKKPPLRKSLWSFWFFGKYYELTQGVGTTTHKL